VRLNLISRCNKLEYENKELKRDFNSMVTVAESFIRVAHPYTHQEAYQLSSKRGYFPFVPHSLPSILGLLKQAKKTSRKAQDLPPDSNSGFFLDAGCGIGNMMCLAMTIGYTAHGIERCRKNVKAARRATYSSTKPGHEFINDTKVFHGDILKFKHYNKYDVIYYFCPISKHEPEVEFERLVESKMKVGAVLVPLSKSDGRIRRDKRFETIKTKFNSYNPLFLKISK